MLSLFLSETIKWVRWMKYGNIIKKIKEFVKDNRASPLVEEGLLIGLAIIVFLVIVTIVSDIIDWVNDLASELP